MERKPCSLVISQLILATLRRTSFAPEHLEKDCQVSLALSLHGDVMAFFLFRSSSSPAQLTKPNIYQWSPGLPSIDLLELESESKIHYIHLSFNFAATLGVEFDSTCFTLASSWVQPPDCVVIFFCNSSILGVSEDSCTRADPCSFARSGFAVWILGRLYRGAWRGLFDLCLL